MHGREVEGFTLYFKNRLGELVACTITKLWA